MRVCKFDMGETFELTDGWAGEIGLPVRPERCHQRNTFLSAIASPRNGFGADIVPHVMRHNTQHSNRLSQRSPRLRRHALIARSWRAAWSAGERNSNWRSVGGKAPIWP